MKELVELTGRKLTPTEFAKFFFDFDPYKYQQKALECKDRFVMFNWGRQTGKSTTVALKGLYECMWNDNWNVVILAPKQQQASRLFQKVKQFLNISQNKFPELNIYKEVQRETQTLVEFKNGSTIQCLTIGHDGSNIRGITANFIIIDEVAFIENEAVWSSIRPMIIATKGKMWIISTPNGTNNYFYQCYKDKLYTYFHASTFDNPNADYEQVKIDQDLMPDALWRQEYKAEFMEETNSFFGVNLINKFMNKENLEERENPHPACSYFMGIDPAGSGGDSSVYAILEKHANYTKIVKYIEVKKETIPQLAHKACMLHEIWGFVKVFVDSTGIGTGLSDILQISHVPVEGVWQTQLLKEEMYNNLRTQMQSGLISVWNERARKQLLDIKYEYTLEKKLKIYSAEWKKHHNNPGTDDFATAIALAALALKKPTPLVLFGKGKGIGGIL